MKKIFYLSLVLIGLAGTSCSDDDAPLPSNTVNFSAASLGIEESETSKSFTINLSRASQTTTTIKASVVSSLAEYDVDYTTTPAATDNVITLTIPAGETSATVKINKLSSYFDGDEKITFTLTSVSEGLALGTTAALEFSFSSIISEGSASFILEGGTGGSAAINTVFVDLSANEQSPIARKSWNFGFSTGSDFAVILNNTTGSTAVAATTQSLETVISLADSTTYGNNLKLGQGDGGFTIIDDVTNILSSTVIKEGKVYIVSLGDAQEPLYKVKVSKKDANTYTLQYAKSNEATVKSLDIPKNRDYSFVYASVTDNKVVSVEPQKTKWDIAYGRTTHKTWYEAISAYVPYTMSDFIRINSLGGTTAALVDAATVSYDKFTKANTETLTFSSESDVVGANWRSVFNGIYADKYIVIKDVAGNIYKIQFMKMGVASDKGTRGYPEMKYALVK